MEFLGFTSNDYTKLENLRKIKLPLEVILKNNVALSYFIDYISGVGQQAYLFLYLNIEGKLQTLVTNNAHDLLKLS